MNHPQIQIMIGWIFSEGFGVEKNSEKARHWYMKAANEHNYSIAQSNLASLYKLGKGVEKNIDTALEW